jgi:hypothetical protein
VAAPILFDNWLELVNKVFSFQFVNCQDKIKWKWTGNGKFSTKSVYEHISSSGSSGGFKHIWKAKLAYKINIFTWLLENKVVLIKDNMVREKMARGSKLFLLFSN